MYEENCGKHRKKTVLFDKFFLNDFCQNLYFLAICLNSLLQSYSLSKWANYPYSIREILVMSQIESI